MYLYKLASIGNALKSQPLYLTAPNAPTATLDATSSTTIRVMWTPVSYCDNESYHHHEAVY